MGMGYTALVNGVQKQEESENKEKATVNAPLCVEDDGQSIPDASCLDVYFVKMTWTKDERREEESHPEKEAEVLQSTGSGE